MLVIVKTDACDPRLVTSKMHKDAAPFLPADDVAVNWTATTQRAARKAGSSRAQNVTSARLALIHLPSQRQLVGEVPAGHYSRTEMQQLKDALRVRLLDELSQLVAKVR